jgi:hypothetical protein
MKPKTDKELNEKYYDCEQCGFNILRSIAKMKIHKETERIIKYSIQ